MNQIITGLGQYSTESDIAKRLQAISGFDRDLVTYAKFWRFNDYGLDLVNDATRGSYPAPSAGTAIVYPSDEIYHPILYSMGKC